MPFAARKVIAPVSSPPLTSSLIRERIRVDGEMIAEEKVAEGLATIRQLISDWEPHPTFFEITTALALDPFQGVRLRSDRARDRPRRPARCHQRRPAGRLGHHADRLRPPILVGKHPGRNRRRKSRHHQSRTFPSSRPRRNRPRRKCMRARAAECEAPFQIVSEPYVKTPSPWPERTKNKMRRSAIAALRSGGIEVQETSDRARLGQCRLARAFSTLGRTHHHRRRP